MEEIWRDIEDLDGVYEVSNLGRIRNKKTKNIKSFVYDGHYYKFGYDYTVNKKRRKGWYRVHKAVAKAFIPNPEDKPTINHIDGDRKNNKADNLEWATHKEQSVHARDALKINCGENHYSAKYTNEQVREMRRLYEEENFSIKMLQNIFNDKYNNIRRIVKYERWKNI